MRQEEDFEAMLLEATGQPLASEGIDTIQVNVGLRCNQACAHCHLAASPQRTEQMEWPVMEAVLEAAAAAGCDLVDLTGGAPELNPHFRRFVAALRGCSFQVQVRTNLTVLLAPGMETMPLFLRDQRVRLVASMPCYLEENVRSQRGAGVYERSVEAIRRLNALGFGLEEGLPLDLVYNPVGPSLPPEQSDLEGDYRRELGSRFGVAFSRLLTITNMPLGRFRVELRRQGMEADYLRVLKDAFNPRTLDGLMCRHQISVGWDGTLYDCDFNLALAQPVDHGVPTRIESFDPGTHARRRIVTGDQCFGCTAGYGSSCGGALA
ncbi:MAG: arsenosugar biosynthesis radical SAM (seleno)protein ArsS [Planctomycetota bacterium]